MSHINYGISCSDVLIHPDFKDLSRDPIDPRFNDTRKLYKVLWELGLDTNQPIEEHKCLHRNLRNQEVDCLMYRGAERCDRAWIEGGYASIEATMSSAGSAEMWRDLQNIRNRG